MNEVDYLFSERSFQEGKCYFHYANYPYLFKFLTENERGIYSTGSKDKILVAACLSYDEDDLYQMVYNVQEKGYYLRNGGAFGESQESLKHEIRLASTLAELFGTDDFARMLIERNDTDYTTYMERSFHEYEESIEDKVPGSLLPNRDLRVLFRETHPAGYFTDHKSHIADRFEDFIERTNLDRYIDRATFFRYRPTAETFLELLDKANKDLGSVRFLYVEFYQSGYQGIISVGEIDDNTLALFLKYGIVYNKVDVPDRIYRMLE